MKDAIEALGVPHPEVDVILVNGASEDFTARLHDGDDVSVYPVFRSLDIAGLRRVGADPPQPVRFALDAHLGKLVSLLRLAGCDAVTPAGDADLANMAAGKDRVVLTRDVALLKRRIVRHGYWVRHTDPERQLAEVLERFDLVDRMEPFTRCLLCNTPLVTAGADTVVDRLLPRTRLEFQEFRRCLGCERIYWQGSHYQALVRVLDRARARAASTGREPINTR